jgi:hypothetical protein
VIDSDFHRELDRALHGLGEHTPRGILTHLLGRNVEQDAKPRCARNLVQPSAAHEAPTRPVT